MRNKGIILVLFFILSAMFNAVLAQSNHPYKRYGGNDIEMLTLSNGKYNEFFGTDSIEIIGSAILNSNTMKVIGFVEKDTLYSEATLEPEIVSRWLSVDPLASKYPSVSPYNFVANNPIIFIDPDGKEIIIHGTDAKKTTAALQKTTSLELKLEKSGKLTVTIPQAPLVLSDIDMAILNASRDEKVVVNLIATDANMFVSKEGNDVVILVGGFDGSETKDGKVQTTQFFNISHADELEKNEIGTVGEHALHETMESYYGGKDNPDGNYKVAFEKAHKKAQNLDKDSHEGFNVIDKSTKTGVTTYSIEDKKKGIKVPLVKSTDVKKKITKNAKEQIIKNSNNGQ